MKDRFRFRAWNKEEKRMYYDAQNTYDYMAGKPVIFATSFGCLLTNDEEWEVEQCTGLKDKNGKLIYEGDIVKAVTNTYKVIWDRYRWAIKDSQGYIFSEYINDLLYDCEIIGNIHEQPEQKD